MTRVINAIFVDGVQYPEGLSRPELINDGQTREGRNLSSSPFTRATDSSLCLNAKLPPLQPILLNNRVFRGASKFRL